MNPTLAAVIAGVALIKGVPRDRYEAFVKATWHDDEDARALLYEAWDLLHLAVEEDFRE